MHASRLAIFSSILLGLPCVAGVRRPAASELLRDGGFEQNAAGWAFHISGGAAASGGIDSTQKHSGTNSYKLTNSSSRAPHVFARVFQVISGLKPYSAYKVKCWAKGKGCGVNWIGGGPGWLLRTPLPTGDFDWQEISFELDAGSNPGNYELMVLTESPTEALWVDDVSIEEIRSDDDKQNALYAQLDAQLEALKQRTARLEARKAGAARKDTYLELGTAVSRRFIGFAETNADMSLDWIRLQLAEVAQVLDETERLAANDKMLARTPASSGKVTIKNGVFSRGGRPCYFAGYGHFESIIRDVPLFPVLGASLVQDGRAGPSSMQADGSLSENASNVVRGVERANQFGMRVDFLLSPHYYPAWSDAPGLRNGNIGFINFNIFHPEATTTLARWTTAMARELKDKPALHSVCLANEPVYNQSGRDQWTRPDFTFYLQAKHGSIGALNALYATAYTNFAQVPVPADAMPSKQNEQRAYYDWTCFNKQMFANWHGWLTALLKTNGVTAPTHTKIMVFQNLDRDKQGHGVDPELMCQATDLAGCDAYAFISGPWAYDWMGHEFYYDLLHSFRGQPVINSENHVIPDGTGPIHIPMNHTRSVIWQGGLHHQGSTTIWVWEKAFDPSLAGSIYFRPANIYGAGRAMQDLNRLADEVTTINQAPANVALLYSQPSIFWQPRYQPAIYSLYATLAFLGQKVTFVSERQLAERKAQKVPWLIIPNATHVLSSTPSALGDFSKRGGKVLVIGAGVERDEYDRPLPGEKSYPTVQPGQNNEATAAVLRHSLSGIRFQELRDLGTGKQAVGIEYRLARQGRSTLIPLVNFNKEAKDVCLAGHENAKALDLLSGETVSPGRLHLEPMLPVLLRVNDL